MKPEQQWQFDELFSDYEAEIKARENAEKEVIEQCRLNAMGSEREAKLMAELAAKTQECERLKAEEPKGWVEYRKLEASEAEIADLRDDVKRHMQIATEAQTELAEARKENAEIRRIVERGRTSTDSELLLAKQLEDQREGNINLLLRAEQAYRKLAEAQAKLKAAMGERDA
jgi:hypothetical protein